MLFRSAGVVATNEDTFADAENLLVAAPAEYRPHTFGHKGQIMDGWESRRRRGASAGQPHPTDEDHDWAIVRLGAAGRVRGVVVDTAHFTGNYPETAAVQGASVPGHPSPEEVAAAGWTDLVPRTPLRGDTAHAFAVDHPGRFTHVRLLIWPDGGVARLREQGQVLPDPRELDGLTVDLAAQEFGGVRGDRAGARAVHRRLAELRERRAQRDPAGQGLAGPLTRSGRLAP